MFFLKLKMFTDKILPSAEKISLGQKRFDLLRNFSIVSLFILAFSIGWLTQFYRQQAVQDLISIQEENHEDLTRILSNIIWKEHKEFLSSVDMLSDEEIISHPTTDKILESTLVQLQGSNVVKIKIFELEGRTIFSTELAQIGQRYVDSPLFTSARHGRKATALRRRDTFTALQGTITNRDIIASYIPVYATDSPGEIIGVFEIYTDITHWLQQVEQSQRAVIIRSLLILALIYSTLFFFILKADTLLKYQYQKIQDSEGSYREKSYELKKVLTELRQTQTQMIQSEKMSALGQMVAGVAHEINNPVNFIHGNLKYVKEYVGTVIFLIDQMRRRHPEVISGVISEIEADSEDCDLEFIQEDLSKILGSMQIGTDRIRQIVLSLRKFSRLDESDYKSTDIHDDIESSLMILQHRLKAKSHRPAIKVVRDYGKLPLVECFPSQLNQAVMNILANGIDAVEERYLQARDAPSQKPLTITVSTALTDDNKVKLAIADTGIGMDDAVRDRIFDPFYTTKPVGVGTGLGMSITYQIVVDLHQGTLQCESTPGEGTAFTICIPVRQR